MKSFKIASLALASIISAPLIFSSANAVPEPTLDNPLGADGIYSAKVEVVNGTEIQEYTVESQQTIAQFMESRGLDSTSYRTVDGADVETSIPDESIILIQKSERSTESKDVTIKRKVVEKKTDDLKVGEKKVDKEGKDGKAVNVTVFNHVFNPETGEMEKVALESNLTITETPKTKVILVGTAEEEENNETTVVREEEAVEESDDSSEERTAPRPSRSERSSSNSERSSSNSRERSSSDLSRSTTSTRTRTSSSSSTVRVTPTPKPVTSPRSDYSNHNNGNSDAARGQRILDNARQQIGTRYLLGGYRPGSVMDCSALVHWSYAQEGINLPRTANAQKAAGRVIPKSEAKPGDIVHWPGHVGIYAGGNKVVDAGFTPRSVTERNIWGNPVFVTFR